jgi:predicted CXXCH cytochrome family protein
MSEHPLPSSQGESLSPPACTAAAHDAGHAAVRAGNPRRVSRLWLLGGTALVMLSLAAAGMLWLSDRDSPPLAVPPATSAPPAVQPPAEFPLPAISSSPFRNTGPEARYVGSDKCQSCHQGRTASFRSTGMGCSMAEVDPAREPADGTFDHAKSKRRYQVVRKDGKLWHRELLLGAGPAEVVLSEYPLKYVVGSGRQTHSYLVEADGFLVESPVTWYKQRQAWGMSPGYDQANHQSFTRPINEQCLYCHAGQAQTRGKSLNRWSIQEPAISCERCHGPGSLHVDFHTGRQAPTDLPDFTIVNPKHLSRDLAEAVCQQCHLRTAAMVLSRGRQLADFRPGLPLKDFRQDYWLAVDNQPMTVVGHVEQMHLSRCYQQSPALTCTTCHNPHAFPRPDKRAAYYQAVCVSCHQPERCTVDKEKRQRSSPDNNCVHCHMPSSTTDIPHLSSTHHRIAVHEKLTATPAPPHGTAGTLHPFLDHSHLGDIDKKRSLGLAYMELARGEHDLKVMGHYQTQALQLMSAVYAAGLRDPVLTAPLARLHFDKGQEQGPLLAEDAQSSPDLTGPDRCSVLVVIATERFKRQQYKDARAALYELIALRRVADDWLMLANCEKALGNPAAQVAALQMAVRIDPWWQEVHQYLADYFRKTGEQEKAAWHQQRAKA